MFKYLKIWIKVIKNTLDIKLLSISLSLCLVYYLIVYFLVGQNNTTSIVLFLLGITLWQSAQIFIFYKELVNKNQYDFILLKPIYPLFGIILYHKNPLDIIVLLPVLLFVRFRKNSNE